MGGNGGAFPIDFVTQSESGFARALTIARGFIMAARTDTLSEYAQALIAGLQTIPVEEIVSCVRDNLKATQRVRLSKDNPEGVEEPDGATRQRAVEFVVNQCAGAAGTRKPVEPPSPEQDDKPVAGILRARRDL